MKKISRLICTLLMAGSCIMQAYAQENVTFFLHTIEKGQSLYSIASMYGISQADIVRLNPGTDERIYAGQTLRIPQSTDNTLAPTFHTIVEGETLYSLTRRYHTTAKAICDANPGLSAQNFRAGQVICIPVADKNLATEDKKSAPQQNVQNPAESPCRDMHKVKRRETVFSISRKYGITEEQLIAANPEIKDKEKLDRGSWLCIPYPQKQTEQTPTQEPVRITPETKVRRSLHCSPNLR